MLIADNSYEQMWADIKEKDLLKSELQACLDKDIPTHRSNEGHSFSYGLAAGTLMVLILLMTAK